MSKIHFPEFLRPVKPLYVLLFAGFEIKKLNLNSATIDELKALPGMTPEIAEAIIEGRPYKIVDELLKIKGIGEKELTKLQDFLEAKPPEEENDSEGKGWQTRERNFPPQPAP